MRTNNDLVLITGGSGFIGSHIVEELIRKGYQVRCLVRRKESAQRLLNSIHVPSSPERYVEFVYGDVTKEVPKYVFRDVAVVLHLAASIETGYHQNYDILYETNVMGTKRVAEAALVSESLNNFIYFSSMAAIGIRNLESLVTEDIECKPDTPYGKTKYEAELLLKKFWHENGLPVTILRLPTVYGPREPYNFTKLVKAVKSRKFVFIGNGENLTSVLYVKNLSHEIDKFFQLKGRGEVYHLADAEPISWKKLIGYISEALGIRPLNIHIPVSLAKVAALAFEMPAKVLRREPPLHRGRVKTLTSNFAFSIEKAMKEVVYSTHYSKLIGIKETVFSMIIDV
jgi:nucleoside-diphosphate-sugar epimerase